MNTIVRNRNIRLCCIIIIIILLILTSCKEKNAVIENAYNKDEIKIAVLIYRFDDQFINSLMNNIEIERQQLNKLVNKYISVEFINANNQKDLQYEQIENMIQEKYDVLAINLVDRSEASRVINIAKEADIPIVFFNREPVEVDMARWDKLYYVGLQAEEAGKLQGEMISDYWKTHPEIDKNNDNTIQYIMLAGQPDHQDTILRSEYSIKEIKENGIMVEELVNETANWQRQEAKEKMINYLRIFGDEIEFIISNNDTMALGAIDAMKENIYFKANLIPTVGVDALNDALVALEKGEMIGTILNDGEKQGQMIMRIAYYLAIGEDPKDIVDGLRDGKYYMVEYKKVTQNP